MNSLEANVQNQIKSLGTNTIYIDKWQYMGGADYPWWKFVNRPVPKFDEVAAIKERSQLAGNVAFIIRASGQIEYEKFCFTGSNILGSKQGGK